MKRVQAFASVMLLTTSCARVHERSSDAGPLADAVATSSSDGSSEVVSWTDPPPSSSVACGPNTCLPGEICCAAACGVCAPASACNPEAVCPVGVAESVICGGQMCETRFCCPTCEADVCAPAGATVPRDCPELDCG